MADTILATYDSVETAERVINDLREAGFSRGDIGMAVHDPEGEYARHLDEDVQAGDGAGFGSIVGTLVGAAAGLVAITVPGIGPIIAAGPLAALGGAAAGAGIGAVAGAATGGITAALLDMGVSDEDAEYYAESLRRGDALVAVTTDDENTSLAMQIMHRHQPIDIDRRLSQWRQRGWSGFDPMADPYTAEERAKQRHDYDPDDLYYDEERHHREDEARRNRELTTHDARDAMHTDVMDGQLGGVRRYPRMPRR
jgi:uncharacterized membrane protein